MVHLLHQPETLEAKVLCEILLKGLKAAANTHHQQVVQNDKLDVLCSKPVTAAEMLLLARFDRVNELADF